MGIYDELVDWEDPINKKTYKRGNGRTIREATQMRDKKMVTLIKDYMPDRKVRILELGSGRGGLARFISRELMKDDKLELFVASNISEEENQYNRQKNKEENFPDDKIQVEYGSFDDLQYESGSFDIICSNDSILHSTDKSKVMTEIARILKDEGICVITDILQAPNVDKDKLTEVYKRLNLPSLGNHELYDQVLTDNGMTKLVKEVSPEFIVKHFGMVLYSATEIKRDELLGPNGVSQEFVDRQVSGLHKWIQSGIEGLVEQGWFVYRK